MRKLLVIVLGWGLVLTGCGRSPAPSPAPAPSATSAGPAGTVGTLINPAGRRLCTATVVGRDLLLTAAHCVRRGEMTFAPRYADGRRPLGTWKITGTAVEPAWTDTRDDDADLAFLRVAALEGRHLGDVAGVSAPVFTGLPDGATVTILSYPNSSPVLVTTRTEVEAVDGGDDVRISGPALGNGSSGSPFYGPDGGVAAVLGGYLGGGTKLRVSYATVLDERAERLYRKALATL
ncbi:trypsin-like peptidase domain-containing protein [Actinocorallia lasiicapitis]